MIVPSNDAEFYGDSRYIIPRANSLHTNVKHTCFNPFRTIVLLNDVEFYGDSRYILLKANSQIFVQLSYSRQLMNIPAN